MCLPNLTWICVLLASRRGTGHATNRAMLKWDQTQSQHRPGMLHAKEFTTWVPELSSFSVSPLALNEMWGSKVWRSFPTETGLLLQVYGASNVWFWCHSKPWGSAPGWFQPLRPGDPSSCPGRSASLRWRDWPGIRPRNGAEGLEAFLQTWARLSNTVGLIWEQQDRQYPSVPISTDQYPWADDVITHLPPGDGRIPWHSLPNRSVAVRPFSGHGTSGQGWSEWKTFSTGCCVVGTCSQSLGISTCETGITNGRRSALGSWCWLGLQGIFAVHTLLHVDPSHCEP